MPGKRKFIFCGATSVEGFTWHPGAGPGLQPRTLHETGCPTLRDFETWALLLLASGAFPDRNSAFCSSFTRTGPGSS